MKEYQVKIAIVILILFCFMMVVLKRFDFFHEQESIRKWEEGIANKFQSNPSSAQTIPGLLIQDEYSVDTK